MFCPICNKHFESGKFCPDCEGPNGEAIHLINDPTPAAGVSLGDAAAISGGLHVNDSHAVHNEDKSVHNITNTTSTVNNITQVSAQKTELEILQEHKTMFLNACKRAYEDNVLEPSEAVELEELRIKIGLDKTTADSILESVRVMSERNARKSTLNQIAKTKLKILTDNLQKNEVNALMNQIGSFEPLVRKFDNDELTRNYYLVLSALKHDKCIEQKERSKTDSYWESFWCYLAYIKAGRLMEAEETLASLDHFTSFPEDNMTILAAAGALMLEQTKEAREFLNATTGEYTPALQRFVDSLYILLEPDMAKEIGADENNCVFYLTNFFGQKNPKAKAEEERLRKEKEEVERKRKEAEDEAVSLLTERKQKVAVPRQWFMAIGDAISFDEVEDYWSCFGQPAFSGLRVEEPTVKSISKFCSSINSNDDSLVLFNPQKTELIGYSKGNSSVGILYFISRDTNNYYFRYAMAAEAKQVLKDYFSSGNHPSNWESWQKSCFTDLLSK
jgi:hypothetical protein